MHSKNNPILLWNRETKQIEQEEIFGPKLMYFFYKTFLGNWISRHILCRKLFSVLYGKYNDSGLSKKLIQKFANQYSFNLDEMEKPLSAYVSFNDFFTRKLKSGMRPISMQPHVFISPADSKLLVHKISHNIVIPVKGRSYTLEELTQNSDIAHLYQDGFCMVFRLAPKDYHRFCYIDKGHHQPIQHILGKYYSVHPFALHNNHPAMTQNNRDICILQTENFGDIVYIDVGAMFVGTIVQNIAGETTFEKGQEKGYFKFGGSTILLLVKKGILQIDPDILSHSNEGIETIVKYGESIGIRNHRI